MNPLTNTLSRRAALKSAAAGFGYLAFAGLSTWAAEKDNPLAPKRTHFPAKARHVIFLCMDGGPSHVDTFDYKPKLPGLDGKTMPRARAFARLLASPWKFSQHGASGLWISELFPELARHADELCLLRGMHTDVPAHSQALLQMHTGIFQFKRPSLGAWTFYGLGTDNANLPGFVTISPSSATANYGSAFLPAVYQGTPIRWFGRRSVGVSNLRNFGQSPDAQRSQLDFLESLNRSALQREPHDQGIEGAIRSFELAFRMQKDLPKVMDLARETNATRRLYGIGEQATDTFGQQCLLARRLVEAGVRFVELTSGGWDHHANLKTALANKARSIDRPIAGLLRDLKARGLLHDTLVLWGGEFGRTPYAQGRDGRDHNHRGYTMWLAGGGVKGGFSHGATDDYGHQAVEGKVHVHDWHATILHLLGLDHKELTYRYAGRDMRLTDVKGHVVNAILA
jgi:hypothetical protein